MRAKLSVVMPTLDAGPALARSLPALTEGLQAGLIRELVISDGGSTDDTLEIAEMSGAVVLRGAASRGGQLRRGAEAAQGEWLLFLHADTVLPEGWAGAVLAHLATGNPACFRLRFDARGLAPRLVAGWANLRTRLFHLPYGDQALLISASDYRATGGYDDIPLMEDVAMARKLGRSLVCLPLRVATSAARYEREGWLRRGAGNLLRLLRYLLGADPARLARRY
ncbi:MAG: TIGR04283 family arsenosugar biosynthesis glycosyltransferase [Roseovarius sp.]